MISTRNNTKNGGIWANSRVNRVAAESLGVCALQLRPEGKLRSGCDQWRSMGKPWETPLEHGESTGKTTGKDDLNHEI